MTIEHGRLPWPTRTDLADDQRDVYDSITQGQRAKSSRWLCDEDGRLHGPFNAMLMIPGIGGRLQELGAHLRFEGGIPDLLREVAILEVARARRSDFEWHVHEQAALAAGASTALVQALKSGKDMNGSGPEVQMVRSVVRSLVIQRDLSDELFTAAQRTLGLAGVCEMITLVGYYDLLALMLRTLRTPLPQPLDVAFD